jgi:Flp pilus assembly protein TadD
VVKTNPNHIDGLYYLGKLAIESNQLEKAIERFKKLVSLQPQNREFYLELSGIYNMMGNKTESKAWADKANAIK